MVINLFCFITLMQFDIGLVVMLIVGFLLIKIFDYDKILAYSPKVMYFLIPFSLIVIFLYDNFHSQYTCKQAEQMVKWVTIIIIGCSIYLYFYNKKNSYPHTVYKTTMRVIWSFIIIFALFYYGSQNFVIKVGMLKFILFFGLLLTLAAWTS